MVDEITISDYALNAPPRFRVVADGDQMVIRAYDTNEPLWRINGKIGGGGVEVMTTTQRMSITPEVGELIYDTTLDLLFVGDGETVGGNVVAGGGGSGSIIPGYRLYTSGGITSFNPVADIVTVTGASVTLQPDTAYKILATTGAVNVTANPPAANKWAYEGHAEIFVGSVGYVVFDTSKIVLANQLEPDSVNNCTLRFHDGMCYVSVEDHITGYIVVNGSTAGDGSLYYGITTSTNDYVAFDASLNGTTIPLAGATAEGEKHVVGNGYSDTILTGAVDCGTSKFTVANLALSDIQVTGGTLTMGDVYIPNGATVSAVDGAVQIERVSVDGKLYTPGGIRLVSGGIITGDGTIDNAGRRIIYGSASCSINGVTLTNNGVDTDGANGTILRGCYGLTMSGVTVTSSIAYLGMAMVESGAYATTPHPVFTDCSFVDNTTATYDVYISSGAQLTLAGTTKETGVLGGGGGVLNLASGAIIDLTGNSNPTPINPGGGITFESGGATVYPSAGQASAYMLGGMTIPKIMNTTTVDLGGTSAFISSGITASASGCVFSGTGVYFYLNQNGLNLESCTLAPSASSAYKITLTNAALELKNTSVGSNNNIYLANSSVITFGGSVTFGGLFGGTGSATVTISNGATVDLTGNANPAPIAPGGGIKFESGGATVLYSSGAVSGSYMMGNVTLPAGAKLTNTAVVDLDGSNVEVSSGSTISASGCTFTSGTGGTRDAGGAIQLYGDGASATLTSCTITGNTAANGGGLYVYGSNAVIALTGCIVSGNTGATAKDIMCQSLATVKLNGGRFGVIRLVGGDANATIQGETALDEIRAFGSGGSVTISGGASINLTSSIAPGGGITVLTGGCTVNGNTIPAGTYTSIDSTGTPT